MAATQSRSLASRFVLQFTLILLPLALVVIAQMVLDSWNAAALDRSHRAQALAYDVRRDFKVFIDGVVDAVDTGGLSNAAKEKLQSAAQSAEALQAAERTDEPVRALVRQLNELRPGIASAAKLQDLVALRPAINSADTAVSALVSRYDARIEQGLLSAVAYASAQRKIVPLVLIVTLVITGLFIRNTLIRPIVQAEQAARTVAAGTLRPELELDLDLRKDLGSLLRSIGWMNDSLYKIIHQVKGSAQSVSGAAQELAGSNDEIARHVEHEASAIEEISASMEELSGTVKQNAENASSADGLAQGASSAAAGARTIMADVVSNMDSIAASARQIAGIVAMIDDIAFQTNILALNAAVEAARAGESGRGFAVVASEVRALAMKSASAANDIKKLVGGAVTSVGQGHDLVQSAARTIDQAVQSIQNVAPLMRDIAAASREQSSGIDQVKSAIEGIEKAISSSGELVGQAVASSRGLESAARNLTQVVDAFRLEEARHSAAAPAETSAAEPEQPQRPVHWWALGKRREASSSRSPE
jgi:methyl-accepting chemotaxis protein